MIPSLIQEQAVTKLPVSASSASLPAARRADKSTGSAWKKPELPVLLFLGLLLVLLALPQSPMLRDLDVGWLIRDGEFIRQNHHLPAGDLYSFTNFGRPWILYKWGFELYLGVLHHWASLGGVVWGIALTIALTYALLLYYLLRLGVNGLVSLGLVGLAIAVNIFYSLARPTTPTFLLYTVALIILEDYRRAPGKQIWALPPLFLLWTNLHLGFIVALGAVGLYGLAAFLVPATFRGPGAARDARLLLVLPLCVGAVLINPYGLNLLVKIWQHSSDKLVTRGLTPEMRSPNFHNVGHFFIFPLILLLIWVRGKDYPGRPLLLTLVAVTLWLGLYSVRHIPYFSITATFHLGHALQDFRSSPALPSPAWARRGWGWALAGVIISFLWVVGIEHLRPGFYGFEPSRVPLGATEFLARQNQGSRPLRIFSWDDQWANYFIYRLYPRARVFFDTRFDLYGDAFTNKFEALRQEALTNPEVLRPWEVDFLVLKKKQLSQRLPDHSGWALVYEDRQALIYRPLPTKPAVPSPTAGSK